MVPDWVAWLALALAIFSAVGVGVLVLQVLFDRIPSLSFKVEVEGVTPQPLRGTFAANQPRSVAFLFTIWNRTSRDQRLQCNLMVLTTKEPLGITGYSSWAKFECWDFRGQQPIDPREFGVAAGDGRRIAIQGDLRPGLTGPASLEFYVGDTRMGRRHWVYRREFDLPGFAPVVAGSQRPVLPRSG
ncbi:MAG: hypothetical protein WB789_02990 [Thermoplasmata archaeon]